MEKENVFEKIQQFIHSQRRKLALFVCLMLIAGTLPESVFAAGEDSTTEVDPDLYYTVTFHSGTDDIPGAPTVIVPEPMECCQTQTVDLSQKN